MLQLNGCTGISRMNILWHGQNKFSSIKKLTKLAHDFLDTSCMVHTQQLSEFGSWSHHLPVHYPVGTKTINNNINRPVIYLSLVKILTWWSDKIHFFLIDYFYLLFLKSIADLVICSFLCLFHSSDQISILFWHAEKILRSWGWDFWFENNKET